MVHILFLKLTNFVGFFFGSSIGFLFARNRDSFRSLYTENPMKIRKTGISASPQGKLEKKKSCFKKPWTSGLVANGMQPLRDNATIKLPHCFLSCLALSLFSQYLVSTCLGFFWYFITSVSTTNELPFYLCPNPITSRRKS